LGKKVLSQTPCAIRKRISRQKQTLEENAERKLANKLYMRQIREAYTAEKWEEIRLKHRLHQRRKRNALRTTEKLMEIRLNGKLCARQKREAMTAEKSRLKNRLYQGGRKREALPTEEMMANKAILECRRRLRGMLPPEELMGYRLKKKTYFPSQSQ